MKKHNQHGFAFILEILLVAAILIVVGAVVLKVLSHGSGNNPISKALKRHEGNLDPWGEPCHIKDTGRRELTVSPLKVSDIDVVNPMGLMVGGHVTPIDHMYFYPKSTPGNRFSAEVRAMADGRITNVQHRGQLVDGPANAQPGSDEFRLTIEQTCNQGYYYDLITKLAPNLKTKVGQLASSDGRGVDIPVKAGDLIGYVGNQSLDFGVYDTQVNLGFIVPAHYQAEPWKIHTAEAFKYFAADLLKSLDPKITRTVEPRSGRIDFDKDGYLVGNWFQTGTNGYHDQANKKPNYWDGHLAFAYDAYDPQTILISIGFLVDPMGGRGGQYAVIGDKPDPAQINQASGLTKYELTAQWSYVTPTGGNWDQKTPTPGLKAVPGSSSQGTFLVQMTGQRTLKAEYFAGKTSAQVTGFSSAARTYER